MRTSEQQIQAIRSPSLYGKESHKPHKELLSAKKDVSTHHGFFGKFNSTEYIPVGLRSTYTLFKTWIFTRQVFVSWCTVFFQWWWEFLVLIFLKSEHHPFVVPCPIPQIVVNTSKGKSPFPCTKRFKRIISLLFSLTICISSIILSAEQDVLPYAKLFICTSLYCINNIEWSNPCFLFQFIPIFIKVRSTGSLITRGWLWNQDTPGQSSRTGWVATKRRLNEAKTSASLTTMWILWWL